MYDVTLQFEFEKRPRGEPSLYSLRAELPFAPVTGVAIAPFTRDCHVWKIESVCYDLQSNTFEAWLGSEDWDADLRDALLKAGWKPEELPSHA